MKVVVLTIATILALSLAGTVPGPQATSHDSIPRWFCEVLRIC